MESDAGVVVEKSGDGIVQIRFNRPDRLNALGVDMVAALERAVREAVAARAKVAVDNCPESAITLVDD